MAVRIYPSRLQAATCCSRERMERICSRDDEQYAAAWPCCFFRSRWSILQIVFIPLRYPNRCLSATRSLTSAVLLLGIFSFPLPVSLRPSSLPPLLFPAPCGYFGRKWCGQQCTKVTYSGLLSKFRDKFYRQNIDNARPRQHKARREDTPRRYETRDDGPGGTATRRAGFPTARNPTVTGPERDRPRREAPEETSPEGNGHRRERYSGSIAEIHPPRMHPAVSGPSPRSRRSGTCRRHGGGRAGRHPPSRRCSGGWGRPAC